MAAAVLLLQPSACKSRGIPSRESGAFTKSEEKRNDGLTTTARAKAGASDKIRKQVYFGRFDPKRTLAKPICPEGNPAVGCRSPAEARTIEGTLLVVRPRADGGETLVKRGSKLCLADDVLFGFGEMCQTQYQLDVCPDDQIVPKFDGLEGVLLGRRPACSGVALGPKHIATASHCLAGGCKDASADGFVIRGYINQPGEPCFEPERVYRMVRKVHCSSKNERDYVVVEVVPYDEKHTVPLVPVPRCKESLAKGDSVYARGHPFGFPQFFSGVATVLEVHAENLGGPTIETDLDLFYGNSGSPVFRAGDHCFVGGLSPAKNAVGGSFACCGFQSRPADRNVNTKVALIYDSHYP